MKLVRHRAFALKQGVELLQTPSTSERKLGSRRQRKITAFALRMNAESMQSFPTRKWLYRSIIFLVIIYSLSCLMPLVGVRYNGQPTRYSSHKTTNENRNGRLVYLFFGFASFLMVFRYVCEPVQAIQAHHRIQWSGGFFPLSLKTICARCATSQ